VDQTVESGQPLNRYKARDLMRQIAEATHQCGDPGMQFDTTVNKWHPCKNTARINASNPCSEYMFLDDSACNLSSLNLMKYVGPDGQFDVEAFRHAVDTMILAQEIIVDNASYPTQRIGENSHNFRPLGLGFANLGALLMSMGVPYDSDQGRDMAAAITAVMCGRPISPARGFPRPPDRSRVMRRTSSRSSKWSACIAIRWAASTGATYPRRWPTARSSAGTTLTKRAGATATATDR